MGEKSKKWMALESMSDYVIDVNIYRLVIKYFIRLIDKRCAIEKNRNIAYIRTGVPGMHVVSTKFHKRCRVYEETFEVTSAYLHSFIGRRNGNLMRYDFLLPNMPNITMKNISQNIFDIGIKQF